MFLPSENKLNQWTLTKIINRAQLKPVRKVYAYNKMPCINSKPALQVGSENLDEYSVLLQLHYSFCNPLKAIETIEKQAKIQEPFDLIHNKEYKGYFVIDEIEKTKIEQVKDVILYAEITFHLLEVPTIKEYQDEDKNTPDLDNYEQYSENSNRIKDFAHTVKNSIVENFKDTIENAPLSPKLSDRTQEIFASVKSGVIADIAQGNVANIYGSINNISNNLSQGGIGNIDYADLEGLQEAIQGLPNLILDSSLRGN